MNSLANPNMHNKKVPHHKKKWWAFQARKLQMIDLSKMEPAQEETLPKNLSIYPSSIRSFPETDDIYVFVVV